MDYDGNSVKINLGDLRRRSNGSLFILYAILCTSSSTLAIQLTFYYNVYNPSWTVFCYWMLCWVRWMCWVRNTAAIGSAAVAADKKKESIIKNFTSLNGAGFNCVLLFLLRFIFPIAPVPFVRSLLRSFGRKLTWVTHHRTILSAQTLELKSTSHFKSH